MAKLLAISLLSDTSDALLHNISVTVAILVIIIAILWRHIRTRAISFIRLLESDVLRFLHSDDGIMVGEFFFLYCIYRCLQMSALMLMSEHFHFIHPTTFS